MREFAASLIAGMRRARCAGQLAALRRAPALPFLLLLLVLSSLFLFGNDRGLFYRGVGPHDAQSAKYLAQAANLSSEHNFLVFERRTLDANGAPVYEPYNRFPIGGYLLIKLAIAPFDHSLRAQIYAARMLMLLCFAATAALAYLSLCRLAAQRWVALTATLATFSSGWWLYASDMVSTEMGLDMLGLMLCFHGMAIFAQEGRFRQLLAKTGIALLLGWHVYALLLPFIALGLIKQAIDIWSVRTAAPDARLRPSLLALLRGRHLALGVFALLFGMAVLGFNVASEYFALDGKTEVAELPSVQSMLKRTSLGDAEDFPWKRFWTRQFHRIGVMSLPYALPGYDNALLGWPEARFAPKGVALGILAFCLCLLGLAFARHRLLWATLALSGFCWTLPMRQTTIIHNFEALAYTGMVLVFFALALLWLHRLFGERLIAGMAAAALLIFAHSGWRMAQLGQDAQERRLHEELMADFETIRRMTKGRTVFVPRKAYDSSFSGTYMSTYYYLGGSILLSATEGDRRPLADFVVARKRMPGPALLTPGNRQVFLYDRAAYDRQWMEQFEQRIAQAGEPSVRAEFNLHLHENQLLYAKRPCDGADLQHRFFLHVIPSDPADLPRPRQRHGFDNLDFHFTRHGLLLDGKCAAQVTLPEYSAASIRTGQYISGKGRLWQAEVSLVVRQ